jgi:glycosyltransferase involved in cell wall biosynthesis
LDQETSVLVEPTREGFAEGLIKLLSDGDLRSELGFRSKKLAEEKYSEANYLKKLEKIYSVLQV